MGAAVREHAARPEAVGTVVFALYDDTAVKRFGGALERELGRDDEHGGRIPDVSG